MRWTQRAAPLAPLAAWAEGSVAVALTRKLLARPDDDLARLQGVWAPGLVLILGEDLPWVDGLDYLGRDDAAPALFLPTLLVPEVPLALFERALLNRYAGSALPLAIKALPAPRVVAAGLARQLSREKLLALAAA